MTDFNSINPDKGLNTSFNANRQARNNNQEPNNAAGSATPQGDPYANLKTDPDKMLNLMAAQGKQKLQGQIENPAIERSVATFASSVSPERHAQVSQLMAKTYQDEIGAQPSPGLLQDMVDNYLIGQPVIQGQ